MAAFVYSGEVILLRDYIILSKEIIPIASIQSYEIKDFNEREARDGYLYFILKDGRTPLYNSNKEDVKIICDFLDVVLQKNASVNQTIGEI